MMMEQSKLSEMEKLEVYDTSCYMSINVLLADDFEGHQGNGLYNPDRERYRIFKIEKQMMLSELLNFLSATMNYGIKQIRPWSFSLHSTRPSLIHIEEDRHKTVSDVANNQNPWIIFVEVVYPDSELRELPLFDKDKDLLLFFKFYDPKMKILHYCGHHYSSLDTRVYDLLPLLNERAGFNPDTPLALYEEIESSEVEKIENFNSTLETELENLKGSVIIVFHKDTLNDNDDYCTCEEFYRELPHRVDVTLFDKTMNNDPGFDVTLSLKMNYTEVTYAVAQRVGTHQQFIQLFSCQNCHGSPGNPVQSTFDGTLYQLIKCDKHEMHKRIFYCKLSIPVNELEERKEIKCIWVGQNVKEDQEIMLFPTKMGKVSDLLEEAKKNVRSSGKLRIVEVKQRKIVSLLKEDMQLDGLKLRGNKTFRIEEIPQDEINLADDEQLIAVVQFFKSIFSPCDIPLLIKVKHMEPFISIKRKILEKLQISTVELEEFNLFIVTNGELRLCDTTEPVNIQEFEWLQMKDNSTPVTYLGLQHLKEDRIRYISK